MISYFLVPDQVNPKFDNRQIIFVHQQLMTKWLQFWLQLPIFGVKKGAAENG